MKNRLTFLKKYPHYIMIRYNYRTTGSKFNLKFKKINNLTQVSIVFSTI